MLWYAAFCMLLVASVQSFGAMPLGDSDGSDSFNQLYGIKSAGTESFERCETCVCSKDSGVEGDEEFPKKCCGDSKDWDNFCLALQSSVCGEECADMQQAEVEITESRSAFRAPPPPAVVQEGALCGLAFYPEARCDVGLKCNFFQFTTFRGICGPTSTSISTSKSMRTTSILTEKVATLAPGALVDVGRLQDKGVSLLCWDWDKTANDEHTFQQTYGSYKQVADTISADFVALATAWCATGKPQAIVTYNDATSFIAATPVKGPDMIREALKLTLAPECAASIPIWGENLSSTPTAGKNPLLHKAMAHFNVTDAQTVMLVDDTRNNIDRAVPLGFQVSDVKDGHGYRYPNLFTL